MKEDKHNSFREMYLEAQMKAITAVVRGLLQEELIGALQLEIIGPLYL